MTIGLSAWESLVYDFSDLATDLQNADSRSYRDIYITEIYKTICRVVLLRADNYSTVFSLLTISRGWSFWWLRRRWWHRGFSSRKLAVPMVATWLSIWLPFVFSVRLTKYWQSNLPWYLQHWNGYGILYTCYIVNGYHVFLVSLKAGDRRFDGLSSRVATWDVFATTHGAAGVVGLTISCFECPINMIFLTDFTMTSTSLKCISIFRRFGLTWVKKSAAVYFLFSLKPGIVVSTAVVAGGTVCCQ